MKRKLNFVNISILAVLLVFAYSWYYVVEVDGASFSELFSEKNLEHSRKFIDGLMGIGEELPAFRDPESIKNVASLTYETLMMSILSIAMASVGMLMTVVYGARNISDGTLLKQRHWYARPLFFAIRLLYIVTRAVPELIWAMIVVFIFKPGIIPGAIALAIHNFGIVGKLCSEVIESIEEGPVKSLYSSGASNSQMLIYGVFPMVLPKFMTYIVYRWEVIIRSTLVVGFIGAGGLGRQFKLSMSYFNYSEITLIMAAYLLLVFMADMLSRLFRNLSS